MGARPEPLTGRDRVILGLLVFFTLFNVTLDLYLVVHWREIPRRVATDPIAALWAIYAVADDTWIVTPWSAAQEALNVFVTSFVNLWLIWAILKRRPYRHALQLTLGSYLTYSVVHYCLANHLGGYAGMRQPGVFAFLLFYGSLIPWFFGHLYMAWDSFVAITRRFADG